MCHNNMQLENFTMYKKKKKHKNIKNKIYPKTFERESANVKFSETCKLSLDNTRQLSET